MKKKLLLFILAFTILFSCNSFAKTSINLIINGKLIKTTTPSNIVNNKTYLPAKLIYNKIGAYQYKAWPKKTIDNVEYVPISFLKDTLSVKVQTILRAKTIKINYAAPNILTENEIKNKAESVVMIQGSVYNKPNVIKYGSGFIISTDGNIVTNYHVIDNIYNCKIFFNDNSIYSGEIKVIGYDKIKDIAILKIDKANLHPLAIDNTNLQSIGDKIFVIGSPDTKLNTITTGNITEFHYFDILQDNTFITNKIVDSGNSGGALLNMYGKVIGITEGTTLNNTAGIFIFINELNKVKQDKNLTLEEFHQLESGK